MMPPKWERALTALLECSTLRAAAERCGTNERTLRRWLQTPLFAAAFRERARFALDGASGRLAAATADAVETLRRNLASGNPAHEIRAAGVILGRALEAVQLLDVLRRLEELERRVVGGTDHAFFRSQTVGPSGHGA
jgi:hypothetical protein